MRKSYFLPLPVIPFISSFNKCLLTINSMKTLFLSTKGEETKMNMRCSLSTNIHM